MPNNETLMFPIRENLYTLVALFNSLRRFWESENMRTCSSEVIRLTHSEKIRDFPSFRSFKMKIHYIKSLNSDHRYMLSEIIGRKFGISGYFFTLTRIHKKTMDA